MSGIDDDDESSIMELDENAQNPYDYQLWIDGKTFPIPDVNWTDYTLKTFLRCADMTVSNGTFIGETRFPLFDTIHLSNSLFMSGSVTHLAEKRTGPSITFFSCQFEDGCRVNIGHGQVKFVDCDVHSGALFLHADQLDKMEWISSTCFIPQFDCFPETDIMIIKFEGAKIDNFDGLNRIKCYECLLCFDSPLANSYVLEQLLDCMRIMPFLRLSNNDVFLDLFMHPPAPECLWIGWKDRNELFVRRESKLLHGIDCTIENQINRLNNENLYSRQNMVTLLTLLYSRYGMQHNSLSSPIRKLPVELFRMLGTFLK